MVFQCINIRQVPWEVLKTAAFGLGFQHLPRDLANVNARKPMFDPYIDTCMSKILFDGRPWSEATFAQTYQSKYLTYIWYYIFHRFLYKF